MATEDPKKSLGRVIREVRETKGLSQESFAHQCGVHRTYIGSVERGERNVSLDSILKIAKALGLTAAELFKQAGL